MYARDCIAIMEHATATPDGLRDVVEFTICTVNMPLSRVLDMRLDIKSNGLNSKWLSGTKRAGFEYTAKHSTMLHDALLQVADMHGIGTIDGAVNALDVLMSIPGIGMVKAGFIAQMMGFNVACLDRHNIRMLGMKEGDVRISKSLSDKSRRTKLREYVKLTRRKGAEYWWDTWCNYVAEKAGLNKSLPTGDAVSAYHVDAVMMKRT